MPNMVRPRFNVPCVTGTVHPAPAASQYQAGSHVLTDTRGNVIMLLRSDTVNLAALSGLRATVCGTLQRAVSQGTSTQHLLTVMSAQQLPTPVARREQCG